jgi:hypothetical protein
MWNRVLTEELIVCQSGNITPFMDPEGSLLLLLFLVAILLT